jgi:tripartite-type tricarboxylate transporter receptor subunit TctC
MKVDRRSLLRLAVSATTLPAVARVAVADTYPSRPVRLIVGFTAGAASDVVARIFAHAAGPILGQQIVVENKPGAGSSIAAHYVAHAPKDGYTLFLPALSTLTNEIVNPTSPPLDMSKDFAAVAQLAEGPFFLTVNPSLGVHSVGELVALAKSKPGQLSYGSVGAGSLPHLCGVLFEQRAGIKLVHVPYPGSPESVTDLIAGRITMAFVVGSSTIGQINAGQLLPLATTGAKRATLLPNVPTMTEGGVSGFGFNLWLGLLAPSDTPRPIVDKLADAAHKALHTADAIEALRKQGYEALDVGPDEFAAHIRDDVTRWTEVVRTAGLKS